jgi:hypothetical protein
VQWFEEKMVTTEEDEQVTLFWRSEANPRIPDAKHFRWRWQPCRALPDWLTSNHHLSSPPCKLIETILEVTDSSIFGWLALPWSHEVLDQQQLLTSPSLRAACHPLPWLPHSLITRMLSILLASSDLARSSRGCYPSVIVLVPVMSRCSNTLPTTPTPYVQLFNRFCECPRTVAKSSKSKTESSTPKKIRRKSELL